MYQLQVGYVLNPELNSTMSFKEKVEINMTKAFSGATIMPVIKVLQKGNTRVISVLMLYKNRKNVKFKAMSLIVYCITDNVVCIDYLCWHKTKLHVIRKVKVSENRT